MLETEKKKSVFPANKSQIFYLTITNCFCKNKVKLSRGKIAVKERQQACRNRIKTNKDTKREGEEVT